MIGGMRHVVGIFRSKRNRPAEGETVEQTLARLQEGAAAHASGRRAGVVSQQAVPSEPTATPADWYPDPTNDWLLRYWDGAAWTDRFAIDEVASPPVDDSQLSWWERALNWWAKVIESAAKKDGWPVASEPTTAPADWYPDPTSGGTLRY